MKRNDLHIGGGRPQSKPGGGTSAAIVHQGSILRSMTFRAAPVDRALGSAKRMCQPGHRTIYGEGGSYNVNKLTGGVNVLREDIGNYTLDTLVMPVEECQQALHQAGFTRPR